MPRITPLKELDKAPLEKVLNKINRNYFSGSLCATVAWEVPAYEIIVAIKNPAPHIEEDSDEHKTLLEALTLFNKGKVRDAIEKLDPLCEQRFIEAMQLRVRIEVRSGGDHSKWATVLNESNQAVKKAAAAGLYADRAHIAVHPFLLQAAAPQYVISYLIYHELCHMVDNNTPDNLHPESFMELERQFPERDKAKDWLKEHGFPVLEKE